MIGMCCRKSFSQEREQSIGEGAGSMAFSAIVNGYDPAAFERAGWPVILDYLRRQSADAFGFPDMRVTHAWTQDRETTARLCAAWSSLSARRS